MVRTLTPFLIERSFLMTVDGKNMIGHPKHVHKACQNGADLICAQGAESGGHTGDTPTRYRTLTLSPRSRLTS
jgi:hypothetical protein